MELQSQVRHTSPAWRLRDSYSAKYFFAEQARVQKDDSLETWAHGSTARHYLIVLARSFIKRCLAFCIGPYLHSIRRILYTCIAPMCEQYAHERLILRTNVQSVCPRAFPSWLINRGKWAQLPALPAPREIVKYRRDAPVRIEPTGR